MPTEPSSGQRKGETQGEGMTTKMIFCLEKTLFTMWPMDMLKERLHSSLLVFKYNKLISTNNM